MSDEHEWDMSKALRAMAEGDDSAFNEFVVEALPRITKMLRGAFRRYSIPDSEIEDCIHETIMKIIKSLKRDCLKQVNAGWLFSVARSVALDRAKKHSRVSNAAVGMAGLQKVRSTDEEHDREARDYVAHLLGKINPEHKVIIELIYLNSISIEEAATVLGISRAACYKRHARALESLRDAAKAAGGDPSGLMSS